MYKNPFDQFDDQDKPYGVQVTPPDPRRPYQVDQERGQAAAAPYAAPKAAADLTRTQQQIQSQPLQNEATRQGNLSAEQQRLLARQQAEQQFSKSFSARPEVASFATVAQTYASALQAAKTNNKAADNDLVTAYAKILDPGSVVREGEAQTAANVGGVDERVKGYLQQLQGGGQLTAQQRMEIIGQVRNRASKAADQYRQSREYWGKIARDRYGYDPESVLGPNPAQPFQQLEADFFGHAIKNGNEMVQPTLRPGDQYEGQFGPKPEKPPGFSSEQEKAYNAFFQANPNATPDQLRTFGQGMGWKIGNAEEIIGARKKGLGIRPGSEAVYKPDISDVRGTAKADQMLAAQHQVMAGMPLGGAVLGADQIFGPQKSDAFIRGVVDVPTFGTSEEIAAGFGKGPYDQNLADQNAIRDYDRENNFKTRLGGQLLGGAGIPLARVGSLGGMVKQGAGLGFGYGVGSTDGGLDERLAGGVKGAVAGGATAGVIGGGASLIGRGATALGRRIVGPSSPDQLSLLQASQQERVPLNMGDMYPGARNTISTLDTIPGSAGTIRRGIAAGRDAIDGRVGDLGRGGTARENMGQVIQDAGDRFVARSGEQAGRLYNRARSLAADTPVAPQEVIQVLSGLVRQESQTPGGTRAGAVIQRYADAFENGGAITIDGARRMRSELLSRLRDDGGLTRSQAANVTSQIMHGVNADIERSLAGAGRQGAVTAYRQADRYYAQRMQEIEGVTEKLLGTDQARKSPEQTMALIQGMLRPKGDAARAGQMLRRLSPDERRDFAATIASTLGRRSAEEPLSPAQLITNARQLSPAARRLVFGNDGERSIQNLIRLSNAKKEAVNSLNNSRSGQVSNYRAVLSTLVFGLPGGGAFAAMGSGMNGATGAVGGAALAGTGIAASNGIARLMMNPEFTAALAAAPATTSARAITAHVGRMRQIASRNPQLQEPFKALEDRLLRAVNDNIGHSAAASDDEEKKRRNRY